MPEEVESLRAALEGASSETVGPFVVHFGSLGGGQVALAESGVGKVNAAALTHELLRRGSQRVVFTGVAGALAPELRPGDVVIGSSAVQHDVDVTGLGYRPGEVPGTGMVFEADPTLVRIATEAAAAALAGEATAAAGRAPRIVTGRIASGDTFVAGSAQAAAIRERFDAVCAEMEGAACAQLCARWGVPFVIVRSISDSADHAAEVDFRRFTRLAAARSERIVAGVMESVSRG